MDMCLCEWVAFHKWVLYKNEIKIKIKKKTHLIGKSLIEVSKSMVVKRNMVNRLGYMYIFISV